MKCSKVCLVVLLATASCRESPDTSLTTGQVNPSDTVRQGVVLQGVKVLQNLETRELCTAFHISKDDLVTAGHCLRGKDKTTSCRLALNGEVKDTKCFVAQVGEGWDELIESIYDLGLIHLNQVGDDPLNQVGDDPTVFKQPTSGVSKLAHSFRFGLSGFGRTSDDENQEKSSSKIATDEKGYQYEKLGADMTGISDDDFSVSHPGLLCEGDMKREDLEEIGDTHNHLGFIIPPNFTSESECIPRAGASGSPFFDSELNLIGVVTSRISVLDNLIGLYLVRMDSPAFMDILKQAVNTLE